MHKCQTVHYNCYQETTTSSGKGIKVHATIHHGTIPFSAVVRRVELLGVWRGPASWFKMIFNFCFWEMRCPISCSCYVMHRTHERCPSSRNISLPTIISLWSIKMLIFISNFVSCLKACSVIFFWWNIFRLLNAIWNRFIICRSLQDNLFWKNTSAAWLRQPAMLQGKLIYWKIDLTTHLNNSIWITDSRRPCINGWKSFTKTSFYLYCFSGWLEFTKYKLIRFTPFVSRMWHSAEVWCQNHVEKNLLYLRVFNKKI